MKAKKITRSIKITNAKVIFADTETQQMTTREIEVPGTFKSDKELLSYLNLTESPVLAVKVISTSETINRYSMMESDFLKYAEAETENNNEE